MTGEDNPERRELLDLYKIAVDEYRFQAQFNWSRIQYWLAFNTAILAAGVALMASTRFSAAVFLIGALAAGLSIRAAHVAHGYYRVTRDRVRRFELALELDEPLRFDTTPGFADQRRTRINVTMVNYLLLTAVGVADLVGVVAAFMVPR